MRLRNIPGADAMIQQHPATIQGETDYRNRWGEVFGRQAPLHIEVGMGKGQFLLQLAKQNKGINYIGIERYSSVLLRALELYDTPEFEELDNIRFICMNAVELQEVFGENEVDRIYLNFSDPWPKARHAHRRLTSIQFLSQYERILKTNGRVEFKTDNRGLFDFSVDEVREAGWKLSQITYDLHNHEEMSAGNIMTEYEMRFSGQGNPIHKLVAVRI